MPAIRIELEGAFNLRDLGGIPAGGRRVAPGLVYRSDGLHRLTAADAARLVALGIERVFDLRSAQEVRDDGVGDFAAPRHVHVPLVAVTLSPFDPRVDWASMDLESRYLEMLEAGPPAMREVFTWLAAPGAAPAVYHCTGGKDRTGVLTAVLLRILGVDDEEIIEDYALSETYLAPVVEARRGMLEAQGVDPRAIAYLTTTHPERMRRTLAAIDRRWGGIDGYLDEVGIALDLRRALRERLLTD